MGQCPIIRQPEAEQMPLVAIPSGGKRKEQFGKSTKATSKYYKNLSKDDLVLKATLEAITRIG